MNTVSSAFGRVAVGAGLLAGAGAAATGISEIRHRRALSRDELWKRLRWPLAGDALEVSSADGTSIHVALFGDESDAPLIVLAPGWTEELHYYDPLIRVLLEFGWRVAAFDLRGQGASGMPVDGDQSLERYGEDVQAVLTAVSAGTGCGADELLVAGHSMGAMSIAAWAASHEVRSRVRAVALINTGLDGLVAASRLLPGVAPSWLLQWLGTDVLLGSAAPHLPVSTAVSRSILRYAAFGPDAPEAVVSFYEPTLVVAGGRDRLTPVSHSERIASALPSLFELVVLEDVGHMSPLEAPERLASLLVGLAQVGDDVGRALR